MPYLEHMGLTSGTLPCPHCRTPLVRIYYPTIDRPQTRDMELIFTDGETFVHEEKRDFEFDFHYIDADALPDPVFLA